MDEDIDIVVNTISIESILTEKANSEAYQKPSEVTGSAKKKRGRKRKASTDDEDDFQDDPLEPENSAERESERRRSARKSRPNNFYRNFDLDSDSDGESKKKSTYTEDDDYEPGAEIETPKKLKTPKAAKTPDKNATGSGNVSDANSTAASRSSLDSAASTKPVNMNQSQNDTTPVKADEKKEFVEVPVVAMEEIAFVKAPDAPLEEIMFVATPMKNDNDNITFVTTPITLGSLLNNVPTSVTVTSISTPKIASGLGLSPTVPSESTSGIISNAADSGLFGLGNIANVTSLSSTGKKNGTGNVSLQIKSVPQTPSNKIASLSKNQSQAACGIIKNLLTKTKGLGFLLNSKAEGLIEKKVTTDFLKTTKNVSFCIDKTLLLVKLAKNNLISLENEIKNSYSDFTTKNNFANHLSSEPGRVSTPSKTSSASAVDDDSDCEIVEDACSDSPSLDGKKLSLLKRVEKSGITWKPTAGSSPKLGSQEIQLPGQHAVWINKNIMVKKVPQATSRQQSFFWMDGRTLKPPDGEFGRLSWDKSKLVSADRCFDLNGTVDSINSVGWLNLALNDYNINSLLSTRKMTAKIKRDSCSDLGESCSDDDGFDEVFQTPKCNRNIYESHKSKSILNGVNMFKHLNLPDTLNKICLLEINRRMTATLHHHNNLVLNKISNLKSPPKCKDYYIDNSVTIPDEDFKCSNKEKHNSNTRVKSDERDSSVDSRVSEETDRQQPLHCENITDQHSEIVKLSEDGKRLHLLNIEDNVIDTISDKTSQKVNNVNTETVTSELVSDPSLELPTTKCGLNDGNMTIELTKPADKNLISDETEIRDSGKNNIEICAAVLPDRKDFCETQNTLRNSKIDRCDKFIPLYKDYLDSDSSLGSEAAERTRNKNNDSPVAVTGNNDNCPVAIVENNLTDRMKNLSALRTLLQTTSESDDSVESQPKKVFVKRCQKRIDKVVNRGIGAAVKPTKVYLKSLLALSLDAISLTLVGTKDEDNTQSVTPKMTEKDLLEIEINRLTDLSTLTISRRNPMVKKLTKAQEVRFKKMEKLEKELLYSSESVGTDDSSDEDFPPATEKTEKDLKLELQLKSNLAAKHLLAGSSSDSDYSSSDADSTPTSLREHKEPSKRLAKEKTDVPKTATIVDENSDREVAPTRVRDSLLDETQSLLKKLEDSNSDSDEAKWIRKKKRMEAHLLKPRRNRPSSSSKNDSSSAISNWDALDSDSSEAEFTKKLNDTDGRRKNLTSIVEEKSDSENPTAGCSKENEGDMSAVCLLMSSSDSSDGCEETGNRPIKQENILSPTSSLTDLSGKGRKNIRKVLNKAFLTETTKKAAIEEENRIQRLLEKNTQMSEFLKNSSLTETEAEEIPSLVLDFDLETQKPLISVHPDLIPLLKIHQIDGIKFIWDTCFESVKIANCKPGGGCILAHCMGLGKTLQVIALIHSVLTSDLLPTRTVLICCPLSTVLNWVDEFRKWLERIEDTAEIKLFDLSKLKSYSHRAFYLEDWQKTGGVMIMGYEMFRHLVNMNVEKLGVKANISSKIASALISPGPDLVVCDEGHLLRNDNTILAKSMNKITTRRRIVLTGTPLQNNLKEYYCMVNFVKPSLLGTQREYINRFENPIKNGQHKDSSIYDIKIMKKRSHVLHKMLEGCVQRKEVSELYPYLPRKQEYVLLTTLSDCQARLYEHYLGNYAKTNQTKQGHSLLKDFHTLQKIWTHPRVLKDFCEKSHKYKMSKDKRSPQTSKTPFVCKVSNDSDDDVICLEDELRDERVAEETSAFVDDNWWKKNVDKELFETPHISNKFSIVFDILDECVKIGDKMLIFCTSLFTLNTLEYFLKKKNGWALGRQYYRLDGSVKLENRQKWCRQFNMENNKLVKLFLISTRAGGLGINMVAANRVIILDVSWNPSHDVQSIFRIYRFGQKKDCFIYRLVALGTMEEKIYERSVTKQAISCRVVDEQQIDRHYNMGELSELYMFNYPPAGIPPVPNFPSDPVLAFVLAKHRNRNRPIPTVWSVHEHDSLLKDLHEEQLDEEERKAAWVEYEAEKTHLMNLAMNPVPRAPLSLLDKQRMLQGRYPFSNANRMTFNAFPIGPVITNQTMLYTPFNYEPAVMEDSILPDSNTNTFGQFMSPQFISQSLMRPIRPLQPPGPPKMMGPRMNNNILRNPIRIGQPIRKHYKPSPKKVFGKTGFSPRKPKYSKLGMSDFQNVEITEIRGRSCHISPSGTIVKRSPGKPKNLKHKRTPKKSGLPAISEEGPSAAGEASSSLMDLTDLPDTPDKKSLSRRSSSDRRTTPDDARRKRTPGRKTPRKKTPSKSASKRKSISNRKTTPSKKSTPSSKTTPSNKTTPTRASIFSWYSKERLASSAKKLNFTEITAEAVVIQPIQHPGTSYSAEEMKETENDLATPIYTINVD